MVDRRIYLTGGVGSRWNGEAFGDALELSPDRAYCETCAAVATVQWSRRMLIATGESRYADLIERVLFNGFASGTVVELDGGYRPDGAARVAYRAQDSASVPVTPARLCAVPYHAWANRGVRAMRVWVPLAGSRTG
jgi:DUF1680 family protein